MSVKKIPIGISLFFTTLVGIVNIYNKTSFQTLTIIMLISLIIFYLIGILLKKYIIELLKLIKKHIIEQIKVNNKDSNQDSIQNSNTGKTRHSTINYIADDPIELTKGNSIISETNKIKDEELDSELNSIVNVVKEKY